MPDSVKSKTANPMQTTQPHLSPLAGMPAPAALLVDLAKLERDYHEKAPDVMDPNQLVSFGTSGHRGSSLRSTFTQAHVLAITQAICEYRRRIGASGPLFIGKDTHALSTPAQRTALEVLAANGVPTMVQPDEGYTPTPAVSHAILCHNRGRKQALADGIIITPSHNPPEDGGFKYNATNGGPADTDATGWIQNRANELLRDENRGVLRMTYEAAMKAATTHRFDFMSPYVADLPNVVDIDAIRAKGVRIGADPLCGASVRYWEHIATVHRLNLTVVNKNIDARFAQVPVDHDGKIRMDCSSPYAMSGLVRLKDKFEISFGNDPDADRHGIVTPSMGLMNPNHYLAVAIHYLLTHRPHWPKAATVGKTLVSSGLIDRVVASLDRTLCEVPVGFKWFVEGLFTGTCCFGGEESAGASFLKRDGSVWSTDKDGLILALLAAEITAQTGEDPGMHYRVLSSKLGTPYYTRIDAPASPQQKAALARLSPDSVTDSTLVGEPIIAKLTRAPGNNASIGGLKVASSSGWFAARPSGTENIYKIYAESFKDPQHLNAIVAEAQRMVNKALASSGT